MTSLQFTKALDSIIERTQDLAAQAADEGYSEVASEMEAVVDSLKAITIEESEPEPEATDDVSIDEAIEALGQC